MWISKYFCQLLSRYSTAHQNVSGGNYVPCLALVHPLQVNTGEIGSVFPELIWYWCKSSVRLDKIFHSIQFTVDTIIINLHEFVCFVTLSNWTRAVQNYLKSRTLEKITRPPQCRLKHLESLPITLIHTKNKTKWCLCNAIYLIILCCLQN